MGAPPFNVRFKELETSIRRAERKWLQNNIIHISWYAEGQRSDRRETDVGHDRTDRSAIAAAGIFYFFNLVRQEGA